MLRHRRRAMPDTTMRLVYSIREPDDVIYADELPDDTLLTYTRNAPDGWSGHTGHIDAGLVAQAGIAQGTAFVCGGNGFVESASQLAMELGFDAASIRTERFGPTS
jgi:ferredoxin-NADP reductase